LWLAGSCPAAHVRQLERPPPPGCDYAVAVAAPGESAAELVLPSSVEASQETPLYRACMVT